MAFWSEHRLQSVEHSEVSSTVDDDALHGDEEAAVQANWTIGLGDLHQTVGQAFEFTSGSLADISSQTGTSKVQRVDEAQRSSTSSSAGGQVAGEELPEFLLLVNTLNEQLLVGVFEGEVERLSGEVTDHVGQVSTPQCSDTLLLWNTDQDIDDALVFLIGFDGGGGILDLINFVVLWTLIIPARATSHAQSGQQRSIKWLLVIATI